MISCNNFIQITLRHENSSPSSRIVFDSSRKKKFHEYAKSLAYIGTMRIAGRREGGRRGEEERVHVNYERENGGQRRCLRGCGEQLRFNGRREGFAFANRDLA